MRSHRSLKGSSAGAGLVLLSAALVSLSAVAGDTSAQAKAKVDATLPAGDALRVFRDPETGELRAPTASEAAARKAENSNAKVRARLVVKAHGGGMVSAVVGERALEDLVARRDASGKLIIEHRAQNAAQTTPTAQREVQ